MKRLRRYLIQDTKQIIKRRKHTFFMPQWLNKFRFHNQDLNTGWKSDSNDVREVCRFRYRAASVESKSGRCGGVACATLLSLHRLRTWRHTFSAAYDARWCNSSQYYVPHERAGSLRVIVTRITKRPFQMEISCGLLTQTDSVCC